MPAEEPRFRPFRPTIEIVIALVRVRQGRVEVLLTPGGPTEWRLPHTVPAVHEPLENAARRVLRPDSGLLYLEQLRTYAETDGNASVLAIGYLAAHTSPQEVRESPAPGAGQWWPLTSLPDLTGEEERLLEAARARLRERLANEALLRSLLPAEFSLSELQAVHESVLGRSLDKRNFRKGILSGGLVEPTPQFRRQGAHRPARLYRLSNGHAFG
jgi:8-oxo-dGTP diphosphatase